MNIFTLVVKRCRREQQNPCAANESGNVAEACGVAVSEVVGFIDDYQRSTRLIHFCTTEFLQ